ncbi:four helix bundle protein [Candidatus Roizmanbacteria bacterium CG_4_8_14_3_um_filter_34_9]|uniref:Four helix bundle protein n=3 Tax=Candidatus Roizmaniibacteriota TaxID=1752723 RepID=A0A2M7AUF2_9BACT|nr:MAG: four helix bundle protein [Candidatus Roizmanbacteria bacterium CG07_land_8_20_14_0_80_34_15]PIU74242.1 MAG: four helix bundle protein [Candidatus Roizmanbacteria bacterium CG06_land_8_20_14_3_00_34_14]PIW73185.1 MAG: four helix bundle protein [Candidatus Roizmanbacteria bacterium CG_4_8_14_3_um_filter_34_9]
MATMKLKELTAYSVAVELSAFVWKIVNAWDWFNKKTLGSQWVEATDSISANIAERFGRFHKKDKVKFYYNARATVYESINWKDKASERKLISEKENNFISDHLDKLPKEINNLISLTMKNLKY